MIIALFPNLLKKESILHANEIAKSLKNKGIHVVADDEKAKQIQVDPLSSVDPQKINFLITMGGDGTILKISNRFCHLDAPILGINLGHLGYMADVPVLDIEKSLQDLLDGHFSIDKRLVLEGSTGNQTNLRAVNDIVIHRSMNHKLIELLIEVDGTYVNTFTADGIIIATPNGSTAYSLAAGGPIISPTVDAIVITPICPHTISNRPIVLSSDVPIEIRYISDYDPVEVWADGLESCQLGSKESIKIKKSKQTFKLVNLHRHEYFSTLRTKLGWSGRLR